MQFLTRLKQALATLPLAHRESVQLVNEDAPQCIVVIVSSDFEGMDEADRQSLVWGHLLHSIAVEEMGRIEFIFTDAPSERTVAT